MSTNEIAAQVVAEFLSERTATASAEANIKNVVRLAYKATLDQAEGRGGNLAVDRHAYRRAAEVATGGRISAEDIVGAVKFNMGL